MGKTRRREAAKAGAVHRKSDQNAENGEWKTAKSKKSGKADRKNKSHWSSELENELAQIGLRVHEVAADGSCFFRSLADQLEGRQGDHKALRQRIMRHIADSRELFEPFVEDEEPFDDYIERMREEGEWAGNLELQAASVELQANLRIYQAGQPPWTVKNFPYSAPLLHLSYHDGSHYNSVRLADDYGTGKPEPIPSEPMKSGNSSKSGIMRWNESDVRRVKDGTGCKSDDQAAAALEKSGGNVDAAIEAMIEQINAEETGDVTGNADVEEESKGEAKNDDESAEGGVVSEKQSEKAHVEVELEVSLGGKGRKVKLILHVFEEGSAEESAVLGGHSSGGNESVAHGKKPKIKRIKGSKEPNRSSRCSCGSTKKYKNCCGASKAARARAVAHAADSDEDYEESGKTGDSTVAAAMQTLYI